MIECNFEEELELAKYHAAKLIDEVASRILTSGSVNNVDEARSLSRFFRNKMVDASVNDEKDHLLKLTKEQKKLKKYFVPLLKMWKRSLKRSDLGQPQQSDTSRHLGLIRLPAYLCRILSI